MVVPRFMPKLVAFFAILALLLPATSALAGTTGTLSGTVTETTLGTPIAGASITATSPSQTASATTDAKGNFTLLSLAPDSYTVTVEEQGYDPVNLSGVAVFADQTQRLALKTRKTLQEIGHVKTSANSEIVRAGTTADVYSVNAAVTEGAKALGGGGALNQAYSAIAAVPGAFVPTGQTGWNQQVYIRGSYYDQTGYEYDGVPVNRAFDNYAAHTASTLGQQELQVYSGGGPASTTSTGLGGFVNQVIRPGTYPGGGSLKFDLGGPSYYHGIDAEFSGATEDRNFSYFVGFLGSDQDYRYVDQFNGTAGGLLVSPLKTPSIGTGVAPACVGGSSGFVPNAAPIAPAVATPGPQGYLNGTPLAADPGCYGFGPLAQFEGNTAHSADREIVGNFHVKIPHHNDGGKDDIQLLYSNSTLYTYFPDSVNDMAGASGVLANALGSTPSSVTYPVGYIFPNGTAFGAPAANLSAVQYNFPSAPAGATVISPFHRDGFNNDASIIKLQYQKNFGSKAYARLYGYTFYSDWLNNAPVSLATGVFVNAPPDYELSTHTRGFELQLADQVNPANLLQLTANFSKSTTTRWNNSTPSNTLNTAATNLVDATGHCYGPDTTAHPATGAFPDVAGLCNSSAYTVTTDPTTGIRSAKGNQGTFGNPAPFAVNGAAAAAGATWIVTTPGQRGSFNTVSPQFSSFALTDNWHPTDKINVNAGLRYERFEYDLTPTSDPGNTFWAAAVQREACYDTDLSYAGFHQTCPGTSVHPDGLSGHALYSNNYPLTYTPTVLEPRLGLTFTVNPDTVIRASYGRYATPANTASIQYTRFEPNTPGYFFGKFVAAGLGFSPRHEVAPATANNYDISLEKHLKGTDVSFKLTPFFKLTQDALTQVYLDQVTQFVSVINAGTERTQGVEFEITKGDFNRDGLAARLSYTFTNSKIKYNNVGTSSVNPIDQINSLISNYNGFTAAGNGTTAGSPCYAAGSGAGLTAAQCAGDSKAIQNPYYNQGPQPLEDRNGWYTPYGLSPAVFGADQASYDFPHNVALIVNYKKDKWTVTPSVQVQAGQRYGVPLSTNGWDPTTCTQNQQTSNPGLAGTPRAKYADWTSCSGSLQIPNYETGQFDDHGAFAEPTQLIGNLQISYQPTKDVRATLLVANLINTCFGGSKMPWTVGDSTVCSYSTDAYTTTPGISNFYNGASPFDAAANGTTALPYNVHAYTAQGFAQPIQLFASLQFKL